MRSASSSLKAIGALGPQFSSVNPRDRPFLQIELEDEIILARTATSGWVEKEEPTDHYRRTKNGRFEVILMIVYENGLPTVKIHKKPAGLRIKLDGEVGDGQVLTLQGETTFTSRPRSASPGACPDLPPASPR
jgi:hypothetical protein